MALIFFLSSLSQPTLAPPRRWDKVAHLALYAGLGAVVVRALAGGWANPVTAGSVAATVLICTLYGITDEIHQHFVPLRRADAFDVVADAAGAAIAALGFYARTRAAAGITGRR
jgi:VanZ family protein